MASAAKISQQEVTAAADKIRATGIKPTARSVREALGQGSLGTVLRFLQVWQSEQMQCQSTTATLAPTPQSSQRQSAESARMEKAKDALRLESVPRLEAEIERLRAAFESERVDRVQAEKIAAVTAAKLDKTNEQVADLRQRLAAAEADNRAERRHGNLRSLQIQEREPMPVAATPETSSAAIDEQKPVSIKSKSTALLASQLDDC